MNSLKLRLIFCLLLVCNAVALMAQPNAPANHNLGCSADKDQPGGAALSNITNVNVVLPAGGRTPNVSYAAPQNWGGSDISTTNDNENHPIYKFNTSYDNASGGFYFNDLNVTSDNYVHVAIYAETGDQSVKVRLATSGGGNGTYNQYQVDSPFQPLNQGWNYLNLKLSDFGYLDNGGVEKFKASQVNQVGFVFSTGNKNLYVDDIYFYKSIGAANHNLGCSADVSGGITGANNIQVILPAGNRSETISQRVQQPWDGVSIDVSTKDANGHSIYKFTPSKNYGNGGFWFSPSLNVSRYNTYLHAAIYAESETHAQIRLATPGGYSNETENTYPQHEVNTTALELKPGWNYLNIPIDVRAEDRQVTGNQEGFAYWDCNNTFNFNPEEVHQVGFVISEANHSIYVDDMYFYELPYTTVDNDGENIDWNTTSGATDQVKTVFQPTDEQAEEAQNSITNAYDKNNATYYGVSTAESQNHKTEENAYYFVAELINPITVSDVEMVWGNGYPMHYEAYAVKKSEAPNKSNNQWTLQEIKDLCKTSNRLFAHDNDIVSYEPYYNTTSELDKIGEQNGETKYVVIKMWEPMGSTFGFKLDEIHVGAYDEEYYTVDHLSSPELNFNTEKYNQQPLVLTVRNKRNAILTKGTISNVEYKVEDDNDRYVNIDREGNQTNVWASKPGNYVIDINGSVDGAVVPNTGKVKLDVNRDWRGEKTNTKSLIQDLDGSSFTATSSQENTSSENYEIKNIRDNSLDTRWSSGSTAGTAQNQYITIPLSIDNNKEYQIRDLEFVWERAYPATYAVYGFNTLPTIAAGSPTYDDFKTSNGDRLLYEASLPANRDYFPYRDLHVSGANANGTTNTDVRNNLYNSKYLVVAFKEPTLQQNGQRYGVSLWELYGQAVDNTALNKMTEIHANSMSMFFDSRDFFRVHGINTNVENTEKPDTVISNLNDATFDLVPTESTKGYNTNYIPTSKVETTTDAGTTIYKVYAKVDGNELKIAEIWDAQNNTYAIKTENNKAIAGRTFNIGVKYHKVSNNTDYTTSFALTILKKPMDLAANSTTRNLVFDDGYYVKERLEKYASSDVLTVDLRNVDFTTYDNKSLGNVEIPAPRDLNLTERGGSLKGDATYNVGKKPSSVTELSDDSVETVSGAARQKMNPNAVYYVSQNAFDADNNTLIGENGIHGENVALMDNRDNATPNSWYIENLRVFDGYDFAPENPAVNPRTADNSGKIYAHNAIFYTNIPENIKSTLILPFDVRNNEVNGKINFYTPESFEKSENDGVALIKIKPSVLSAGSHPLANTVYIVEGQQGASTFSTSDGYAVQMVSTSYMKNNEVVEVAKAGSTTEINIGDTEDKAKLVGTFMKNNVSQVAGANYLYLSSQQAFLPAGSEQFDFTKNTDNVHDSWKNQNLQNTALPFYVYLTIPEATVSSFAAPAKIALSLGNGTTGITSIHSNESDGINFNLPLYDLMGRRVNKSYRGIVIQNGKKHLMK